METFFLFLLFIPYIYLRYRLGDHDTQAEKDARAFAPGVRLVRDRQYEAGAAYFTRALETQPNCALAYAHRAKCNLKLDNLYSCVFDATRAVSLDQTLAEAYLDKGKALYQLEEYHQSFLEFDKAVWHFKTNPEAFRWRALARVRLSHPYDRVEADFGGVFLVLPVLNTNKQLSVPTESHML